MSSDPAASWYRARPGGIDIRVRLTPRGGRDAIEGPVLLSDGSRVLAVRVRAAPDKGAANAALEQVVAAALGVARATVAVASGHRSRLKMVHVAGDAEKLAGALAAIGEGERGTRP